MTTAAQPLRTPVEIRRTAKIRETAPADYDQIAALHRRNDLAIRPFDQWMRFWVGNPALPSSHFPMGWILENEHGTIVGSIGNIPLGCEFRGRPLRVATPSGWVVDEGYRGYSVMILSRFVRQPGIDLFVFATVGEKAEPIYNGLQLTKVPVGSWDKAIFWITNYYGFSRSLVKHQKLLSPLVRPITCGLYLWDAARFKTFLHHPTGYEIQSCSAFDGRFDEFWDLMRRGNPHLLLPLRTCEALNWHFQAASSLRIVTAMKDSRLAAYAIFNRQDNPALELKRLRLVDFQALPGHECALKPALASVLQESRRTGVHVVEVMGNWLDRSDLPRIAPPYQRRRSSWAYYYKAARPDLAAALRDPTSWAPTSFDGDASL